PGLPKVEKQLENPWFYAALFVTYLTCAFVVVFCNAALAYCAQRSFQKHPATLGEGLAAAGRRWRQVLAWSMISATVGLLLKTASSALRSEDGQKKLGFIGGLIVMLIVAVVDTAWLIATYLVVPIMVAEGIGPFAAITRSSELIKQRWGEAMVGEGGLGGIAILVLLPLLAVGFFVLVATD